ncbi:HNH endonuclease [Janibacter anophelis]|uniref:HNH endonuclease n=1 Tax=Janibacter anophelis TaxID=319054 RepID=UPI003F7DEDFA
MATWIFGIDRANPEHWEYAQRDGIWHLTKRVDVRAGDSIFFWQAELPAHSAYKSRLVGLMRARTDIGPMHEGEQMPWNISDDKRADYKFRIELEVVVPGSLSSASWSEVRANTGVAAGTNFGPQRVHSDDGARWLRWQLDGVETEALSDEAQRELDGVFNAADLSDEDRRKRVTASIVIREGRGAFRSALEAAYANRCAITGVAAPVLDAAHIRPYRGTQSDHPANGLLLRTDLHTLFDKYLLTIVYDGEYRVRVSAMITEAIYRELDGTSLTVVPGTPETRPDPDLLLEHNRHCSRWLA